MTFPDGPEASAPEASTPRTNAPKANAPRASAPQAKAPQANTPQAPASDTAHARTILTLALPALGALIAEPLFLLIDSAFVGHVSTNALAGLAIASTILTTVVGLAVFLAYSTTATVARAVGAGDMPRALSAGIDATWLGLGIGAASGVLIAALHAPLVGMFGAPADVAEQARTYLLISAAGVPPMLLIQAALGLVRGLQSTTITLVVAAVGTVVNVPLNAFFIFGLGWGIAGSAVGTVLCQWGMAAWYLVIIVRGAREHGASLAPKRAGMGAAWSGAKWLFIRTVTLRIVLLMATAVAIQLGSVTVAAHQLMNSLFGLSALALDSLAIAAQALTGKYLGARDRESVRATVRTLVRWSVLGGFVVAVVLLAAAWLTPALFTPDPAVQRSLFWALLVLTVGQPLAGYVFVLDGVYMGAGDSRYLGLAGIVTMACYLPFALLLWWAGWQGWVPTDASWALAALWAVFTYVFLGARGLTLWWRGRTDAWMHIEGKGSAR